MKKQTSIKATMIFGTLLGAAVLGMFAAVLGSIWTGDERWALTGFVAFFVAFAFFICTMVAHYREEDAK